MVNVRLMEDGDEDGVSLVIQRSFNSVGSHARPYPDKKYIVVAEADGKIVAHTSIRPLIMWFHGTRVPCGVLHMVGTDPDYQHQGIGLEVLDKCIEVMERNHLLISLLMTPVAQFYAHRDWISLHPKRNHEIERNQVESLEGDDSIEIEEELSAADLEKCLAMREAFASKHDLFVHTNNAYFDLLVENHVSGSIVNFFHAIKREGELVGYLFGTRDASITEGKTLGIFVREIVCADYSPGMMTSVLKYLLEFDDEFGRVQFQHPIDGRLVGVLEGMGAVTFDHGLTDMVRINSLELLCKSIERQLNTSWVKKRRTLERIIRNIVVETDDERVLFQFTGNYLRVIPKGLPASLTPTFKTDRKTFTSIIAGMSPVNILLEAYQEREMLVDAIKQLECLFEEKQSRIRYDTNNFPAHVDELEKMKADLKNSQKRFS